MAALIYRAYEFESLVSVTKMGMFYQDFQIEISSNGVNAMKLISKSVETHKNVNLSVRFKESICFHALDRRFCTF